MNQSTPKQETPPLSLCPIPRRGIPGIPGFLLFVLLTLSALLPPLGVTALLGTSFLSPPVAEGVALLYLILLVFYFNRTSKLAGGPSRGITPLLVLSGLLSYGLFRSLIPVVIAAALIFVIGEGAVWLATANRFQGILFPFVPLLAFGVSLVLCGRGDVAALALLPFPAALVLALGTRSSAATQTGLTRVGVICAASLVFGFTAICLAAGFIYHAYGALNPSVLSELLDALRAGMKEALMNYTISYGDNVITPLANKEAEVVNVINSTINTLPGTLVMASNVIITLAQMVTFSGLHAYGFGESVTGRVRNFRISPVSGAVFLLSWIVALVAVGDNNASTMIGTVAENLYIILLPGLALAGLFRFMRGLAMRGARTGCGFFLVVLVPCLVLYVPAVAALYETVALLFAPLLAKLKRPREEKASDEPPVKRKDGKPLTDEELFDLYCREQEERRKRDEQNDSSPKDDDNDR